MNQLGNNSGRARWEEREHYGIMRENEKLLVFHWLELVSVVSTLTMFFKSEIIGEYGRLSKSITNQTYLLKSISANDLL